MKKENNNLPTGQDYISAFNKVEFNPQREMNDTFNPHQLEELLKEPVYCIIHHSEIKFGFWDRVKIMLGANARYNANFHTDVIVNVMKTDASIHVNRLIKRKSKGMIHQCDTISEIEKTEPEY